MTRRSPTQVLADVNAALVRDHDITDILSTLLHDAIDTLDLSAAGLLVTTRGGDLELLSATSHRVAVLEIFQAHHGAGPCVDCMKTRQPVTAQGAEVIADRWPEIGPVIAAAGFQMVHAQPMLWHNTVLGGMNFFRTQPEPITAEQTEFIEAITDAAMLALIQTPGIDLNDVIDRIQTALYGRILIERAKGVLAHREHLDMETAYQHLVNLADSNGTGLAGTAEQVIQQAITPSP